MKSLFEMNRFGRAHFMGAGASVEELFSIISSIKGPLISERKEAASDFKLYSDASKRRVQTLDALGRAEAALEAASRSWEASHKNQAELMAAQNEVNRLTAEHDQLKADVATYRALVDQHAAMIQELWRRAEEAIASLPADRQADAREMLTVCAVNMGGTCLHGEDELGCKKCQNGKKKRQKLYNQFRMKPLGQVGMAGSRMGQFDIKPTVNVNPNFALQAPINVDLGGLPLSLGLFAGGGLAFFVMGSLPKGWPRYTALGIGAALSAGGVLNLVTSKARANEAAAKKPLPPPAPPPVIKPSTPQGEASATEYQPAAVNLLGQLSGRIVSPKDYDTIDLSPWSSKYPVRIELQNPTQSPIPFVLDLVAQEEGFYGSPEQSSHTSQVTVNPGMTAVDVMMPLVSGHTFDTISVTLTAYKRRSAQDPAEILDMKGFLVK